MKSKQFHFKQILKLYLLKHKIYESGSLDVNTGFIVDGTLNRTLINFKKILQIIFQFHIQNRRILFVGVPKKLELKINKLTQHTAIPSSFDVTRILSNNFMNTESIDRKLESNMANLSLSRLSRKPDLVVLVTHDKIENVLKNCFILKIPTIDLSSASNLSFTSNSAQTYRLRLGDEKTTTTYGNKNIFFIGLSFLFKIDRQNELK